MEKIRNNDLWIEISDAPVDAGAATAMVGDLTHGASTLFLGVVRNLNHGRPVEAVSYEAYTPLALGTFSQICSEAKTKWGPTMKIGLIHRIGRLQVGEISVLIAVGTPHRDEAYQASRYIIEELKTRAPIWKKEHYHDGESEWLRGHALCSHSSDPGGRTIDSDGH